MKSNTYNDKFTYLFEKYNIDTKNIKFLLAVSGGLDSICMFNFFLKNKFKFSVCHCNFNLRKDSKKDLMLVEKLSKIKPPTLGAASRISGVTPAATIALLRYIKKNKNKKAA